MHFPYQEGLLLYQRLAHGICWHHIGWSFIKWMLCDIVQMVHESLLVLSNVQLIYRQINDINTQFQKNYPTGFIILY